MAIRIKPVAQIASKWAARAQVAGEDYKSGVQNPKHPQAEAAIAQNAVWKEAMQAAIARDAFEKGLVRATSAKWQRKALAVGASRYGPGVSAAQTDYVAGFTPIAAAISAVDLGPKFPRGDPRNQQRSVVVQVAARQAKLAK